MTHNLELLLIYWLIIVFHLVNIKKNYLTDLIYYSFLVIYQAPFSLNLSIALLPSLLNQAVNELIRWFKGIALV